LGTPNNPVQGKNWLGAQKPEDQKCLEPPDVRATLLENVKKLKRTGPNQKFFPKVLRTEKVVRKFGVGMEHPREVKKPKYPELKRWPFCLLREGLTKELNQNSKVNTTHRNNLKGNNHPWN